MRCIYDSFHVPKLRSHVEVWAEVAAGRCVLYTWSWRGENLKFSGVPLTAGSFPARAHCLSACRKHPVSGMRPN